VRALRYFFSEATASLWRGWQMAALSTLTIAAGLFVLGFFLMVNANLQRLVGRWTDAAELAVYLRDEATPDQTAAISDVLARSGLAQSVKQFSKDDARSEFARDFPELAAGATALDRNPFPASFEIRLNDQARDATGAIDNLVATLNGRPGVADVRYDRRWLSRLNATIRVVRGLGLIIILLLAFACALTVANVVRLAAMARRDEIEIMQLVGAPFGYIRGPFVVEGFLQGGIGAVLAVVMLLGAFAAIRARYGAFVSEAVGLAGVSFVPSELLVLLIFGGMALGCLGGFIVARGVR
jgi:cell division transport system permease protein